MNKIEIKHRSILNIKRGDSRFKITNMQTYVTDLLSNH